MNSNSRLIKKLADILAVVLIVMIFAGIANATGFIGSIFSDKKTSNSETLREYSFSSSKINELYIDIGAAELTFGTGENLTISADEKSFLVKDKNGKLYIEEKEGLFSANDNRHLNITLPREHLFKKVELDLGASAVNCELLCTEILEIDTGAGAVKLNKILVTQKADIDCGAGEFTLTDALISNLDFSLGVGSARLTATLTGSSDIESGVGELELTLKDGKENYRFDIERGLGAVIFDGAALGDSSVIGDGENRISLEGGVGKIEIAFAD